MSSLSNKRILLGVTGGIAAYKSAELLRRLIELGADVRVVMTKAAQEFITPLTMQALSGNPVHTSLLDTDAEAAMGHIELARWGDCILVAPASADFIARLSSGEGSDLLTTLCLASRSQTAIAPAMNQAMWAAAATCANIDTLKARGVHCFGPASGEQACGDVGMGRMEDPGILATMCADLFENGELSGKAVVITAGPTREAIDPVRYISNHSSGKMGYALADAAVRAGANVTLISGPVSISVPDRVRLISVVSTNDMYEASLSLATRADIFIGAAAVADYRVSEVGEHKIKKSNDHSSITLNLVQNPDIIASVGKLRPRPYVVGFAAETNNVLRYARQKLDSKNLDMIIANDVSNNNIGFNSDDNAVTVIDEVQEEPFQLMNKTVLANQLISYIATKI